MRCQNVAPRRACGAPLKMAATSNISTSPTLKRILPPVEAASAAFSWSCSESSEALPAAYRLCSSSRFMLPSLGGQGFGLRRAQRLARLTPPGLALLPPPLQPRQRRAKSLLKPLQVPPRHQLFRQPPCRLPFQFRLLSCCPLFGFYWFNLLPPFAPSIPPRRVKPPHLPLRAPFRPPPSRRQF